jgi:hypothetical protein
MTVRSLTIAVAVCASAVGPIGCSRDNAQAVAQMAAVSPNNEVIPVADRPPTALTQIGESAKWLFDAATAADWGAAADWLQSINESASQLPDDLAASDLFAQFESRLDSVRQDVRDHDRIAAMEHANAITRLVAELSEQFQTAVPFEAVLLGYHGRQLALGLAAGRSSTLIRATNDLQSVWDVFQETVELNGWTNEARRFTDIVVQLEGATRPADFVAPVRAELTEADRIEKLFTSSGGSFKP